MTNRVQYTPNPASAVQFCRFWSATWMLSNATSRPSTWALAALTVVLIAYPIARIVIPAVLHDMMAHGLCPMRFGPCSS